MIYTFLFIILLLLGIFLFMRQAQFGALPQGKDALRIQASQHYQGKSFQNLSPTPDLSEGVNYWTVTKEFLFKESKRVKPAQALPSVHNNLLQLSPEEQVLVWFGHSSYLMQVDGRTFLVDPVLSGHASPLRFTTKSYAGTDRYTAADIPEIDYLLISHDHWDHLDYATIKALGSKIKHIVCGLGVKAHFLRWGFDEKIIFEKDWNESVVLEKGFVLHTTTARHFSGRGFKRNQSLWMSYVLSSPTQRIFIGGDSGYDRHFAEIGAQFGPFDWAILECGQYDPSWKYIHMMPEEVALAAQDLQAKTLLPVHWAKFSLGNHDWDDPIIRVTQAAQQLGLAYKTPMIGEKLYLDDPHQTTQEWWLGIP